MTGGPDDDWIIDIAMGDKGSVSPMEEESVVAGVSEEVVRSVASNNEEKSPEPHVLAETSKVTTVEEVVKEPELGRGCRNKIPSVKLRDYASYNA